LPHSAGSRIDDPGGNHFFAPRAPVTIHCVLGDLDFRPGNVETIAIVMSCRLHQRRMALGTTVQGAETLSNSASARRTRPCARVLIVFTASNSHAGSPCLSCSRVRSALRPADRKRGQWSGKA
jgi:hypothetical protein